MYRYSWSAAVSHLGPGGREPRGRQELARTRNEPAAEEDGGQREDGENGAADDYAPEDGGQAPDHI